MRVCSHVRVCLVGVIVRLLLCVRGCDPACAFCVVSVGVVLFCQEKK